IAVCHPGDGEALLKNFPGTLATKIGNPSNRLYRVFQFFYDKARSPFFNYFGNRATFVRDHWSAAGHGLDHNESKRLRPINRKQQRVRIAEEFVFLSVTDFTDPFRYRTVT